MPLFSPQQPTKAANPQPAQAAIKSSKAQMSSLHYKLASHIHTFLHSPEGQDVLKKVDPKGTIKAQIKTPNSIVKTLTDPKTGNM